MTEYAQVQTILSIVLPQVAKVDGKNFTRRILITPEIADFAVSNGTVKINPEIATAARDPIPFCRRVIQLCEDYDARRLGAHEEHLKELQEQVDRWYRIARRCAGPAGADAMIMQARANNEKMLPGGPRGY